MNILITGVAGFIGFSVAKHFLDKNYYVYGVDNLDNYYSILLKKKRLKILKNFKKFKFKKIDLKENSKLKKIFDKNKFEIVLHFAAQAGVRYSKKNPQKYINSNIYSYINLIEILKDKNVKKFIYASSSSVYGDSKKFPCKESQKLRPINIYSQSKLFNEKISSHYSRKYNIKIIGLRFFTIFGEWGRPDMLIMKIFKSIKTNKTLMLNNYGNHYRDFTYIKDVVKIIDYLAFSKIGNNEIFNICSSKPLNILKLCKIFKSAGLKIKKIKKHPADVYKTHGDNSKLIKIFKNLKFIDQFKAINDTFNWYNKYKIHKL